MKDQRENKRKEADLNSKMAMITLDETVSIHQLKATVRLH
jgi:hypothetical protein